MLRLALMILTLLATALGTTQSQVGSLDGITEPLSRIKVDVGPWNCVLVARLRDDASVQGTVSRYEFEVMNGYAAALNHFTWRLEQVQALRDQIRGTEARKVDL
ncbi:hypothetical protein C7H85_16215 [Zobellella endophytica]|uniref:Uncharacterized protein n=1 Tax=Zobellella endophytica TaxID=2116700 RepID=A0A2P7R0Q1_9GAMM|nr:hypothetical protein [Zobellella endophytica]PSJ43788.1 hypothetical protein C7H85_16215 [Zobellella endophytica]